MDDEGKAEERQRDARAYQEVASAMSDYPGITERDVAEVHRVMREGRAPAGSVGRDIADALRRHFENDPRSESERRRADATTAPVAGVDESLL